MKELGVFSSMYIYVQVLPCLFFCVHVRACVWMITFVLLRRLPLVSWWEAEQLGVKQLSLSQNPRTSQS